MITYITLCKLTDQGIRAIKDVTARADMAREVGQKFGVNMKEIYWTVGQYDLVYDVANAAAPNTIATISYNWPRPGSDQPIPKVSFVGRIADTACAVGYYK